MKYRVFGKTGFNVSEIGLGAWQLGSADWGTIDDKKALAILREAVHGGINFIDTADIYGHGASETRIGSFLKTWSTKPYVATKIGQFPDPGGYPGNYSFDIYRRHTEASLKRLGVDALDLVQLHCIPTEYLLKGEVFGWLDKLKGQGKIRHYGLSVESMDEALYCVKQPNVASLQIIFNVFRQKAIAELFKEAKKQSVAIITRLPLASGLLSGKFNRQTMFASTDHRHYNRDGQAFNVGETFAGIPFEKALELVEKLKAFVPPGMNLSEFALRWILDYQEVSVIIPGATSPAQVAQNAKASDLPSLGKEVHQKLHDFYLQEVKIHIRGKY